MIRFLIEILFIANQPTQWTAIEGSVTGPSPIAADSFDGDRPRYGG